MSQFSFLFLEDHLKCPLKPFGLHEGSSCTFALVTKMFTKTSRVFKEYSTGNGTYTRFVVPLKYCKSIPTCVYLVYRFEICLTVLINKVVCKLSQFSLRTPPSTLEKNEHSIVSMVSSTTSPNRTQVIECSCRERERKDALHT